MPFALHLLLAPFTFFFPFVGAAESGAKLHQSERWPAHQDADRIRTEHRPHAQRHAVDLGAEGEQGGVGLHAIRTRCMQLNGVDGFSARTADGLLEYAPASP